MAVFPFNSDAPKNQWSEIRADGFPGPVPGCVYDGHRLDGGVTIQLTNRERYASKALAGKTSSD